MIVFDWLPRSKNSLSLVAASFGDALRSRVVEMGDEVGSHDVVFVKGPPGDDIEGLGRYALATNLRVEPVERLSSIEGSTRLSGECVGIGFGVGGVGWAR